MMVWKALTDLTQTLSEVKPQAVTAARSAVGAVARSHFQEMVEDGRAECSE